MRQYWKNLVLSLNVETEFEFSIFLPWNLYITHPYLCFPPNVTEEVYCFSRRHIIFSFDCRVIYHLKGLWEYSPKPISSVCLSVCTTIFERITGLRLYVKCLMLYINGLVSKSSTNQWKAFSIFFGRKQIFFKRIARRGLVNIDQIPFQCVIYQWIRLNELYKLMKNFFQILNYFSKFWRKTDNFETEKYSKV